MTKKDLIKKITECRDERCKSIIAYQKDKLMIQDNDHQIPEPWNGHIESAEILFISSNPSIDPKANTGVEKREGKKPIVHEKYPTISTMYDLEFLDFFENRFDNIGDENVSRYWNGIFKYATWMLYDPNKNYIHSSTAEKIAIRDKIKDKIAVTEIVHCKSKAEFGVITDCMEACVTNHLKEILSLFNGKLIVIVGNKAKSMYYGSSKIKEIIDNKCDHVCISAPSASSETDSEKRKRLMEKYNKVKSTQ